MSDIAAWARDNRRFVTTASFSILWLYGLLWPLVAPDLPEFVFPWFRHIVRAGPVHAFATPFSNYSPPYLYLLAVVSLATRDPLIAVKLLGIVSAACIAFALGRLLRGNPDRYQAVLFSFLIPTVTINAVVYGQCDGFWVSACLLAVAAAAEGRNAAMLAWCGVALAFKAQAAFLAPFVIVVLLKRRVSPPLWAIPAGLFALAMLPAWLAGWPATDLATIYWRQAAYFNTIGSAPNPWAIMAAFAPPAPSRLFAIGYVGAAVVFIAYVAAMKRRELGGAGLLRAALLSALVVPFLLPKMHERFTLLADLLSFALAYAAGDRASWRISMAVIGASTIATFGAMFEGRGFLLLPAGASVVETAAIWMVWSSLAPKESSPEDPAGPQNEAGSEARPALARNRPTD